MTSPAFHPALPPALVNCRRFMVGSVPVGGDAPLALIAGPCVIEGRDHLHFMAERLVAITRRLGLPLIFKASYDKANRTSGAAFRGPGLEAGLALLAEIRSTFGVPVLTDFHTAEQAAPAAAVCDMIQIPAFLARQTDFVLAAGRAGKPVNVKKAQFMAPGDVRNVVSKLNEVGCHDVLLTERGVCFGYGALVSDFRSLPAMQEATGLPVCFDATHSVQQPGGLGTATGGQRQYVPHLARAACAVGINALFVETHDRPAEAKSDGPNMVPLDQLETMLRTCMAIDRALRG
jgi:2-dehydro-3-deoxyphosphooctonate aldolase (KDO 8-P synthase)